MRYRQRGEPRAPDRALAWLSVAIVAAGIALRLWQYLGRAALWTDEATLANNIVGRSLGRLLFAPLDHDQVAPLGFLLMEKAATSLFGTGELALRAFPLVASILVPALTRRPALTSILSIVLIGTDITPNADPDLRLSESAVEDTNEPSCSVHSPTRPMRTCAPESGATSCARAFAAMSTSAAKKTTGAPCRRIRAMIALPCVMRGLKRRTTNGQGGIRTHETREGLPVFKTGAFNRSATCPGDRRIRSVNRNLPCQFTKSADVLPPAAPWDRPPCTPMLP